MASWDRSLGAADGGAIRVSIDRPGITHIDFSDKPFWDGSMKPEIRPEKLKTIAEIRAWIRAFFDGTVRGDWAGLKSLAGENKTPQADVTVHESGKLWP